MRSKEVSAHSLIKVRCCALKRLFGLMVPHLAHLLQLHHRLIHLASPLRRSLRPHLRLPPRHSPRHPPPRLLAHFLPRCKRQALLRSLNRQNRPRRAQYVPLTPQHPSGAVLRKLQLGRSKRAYAASTGVIRS